MESTQPTKTTLEVYDCIIIGSGISGIGAGYYLDQKTNKSFKILERRESFGGTWDLFQYPGIRSDSDMYSFSFSFHPWLKPQRFGSGAEIKQYLQSVLDRFNLNEYISYGVKVENMNFDRTRGKWTINATNKIYEASFVFMCTGYYDQDEGYLPEFEGYREFQGKIIHPQKWPKDYIPADKEKVVVIGSGATAVTIVPTLAELGKDVTMLQRSPTYMMPVPDKQPFWLITRLMIKLFGVRYLKLVIMFRRHLATLLQYTTYWMSKFFPAFTKLLYLRGIRAFVGKLQHKETENQLKIIEGSKVVPATTADISKLDLEKETMKHFIPSYNIWDQRVCACPEADFYKLYKQGKIKVVTEHIDRFTTKGIKLMSGVELECDTIVTATGLQICVAGKVNMSVDNKPVKYADHLMYKGTMLSNVPNCFVFVGYTNASWTLKVEVTGQYILRMFDYMDKNGYDVVCPDYNPDTESDVQKTEVLDLQSGYIFRARHLTPKQGNKHPWRLHQNYYLDYLTLQYGSLTDSYIKFRSLQPAKH